MARPEAAGLALGDAAEGLLAPLQADRQVLRIEDQQAAIKRLLPLKGDHSDLRRRLAVAVLMAQGQVGQLQVVGQILGLPVEAARHRAAGLLEVKQPPVFGDHIRQAAAGPPGLVLPEMGDLAVIRIQRCQHLTDHRNGMQGITDALRLLHQLKRHRCQPGGLGIGAIGGAQLAVAGNRAVGRKAPCPVSTT